MSHALNTAIVRYDPKNGAHRILVNSDKSYSVWIDGTELARRASIGVLARFLKAALKQSAARRTQRKGQE